MTHIKKVVVKNSDNDFIFLKHESFLLFQKPQKNNLPNRRLLKSYPVYRFFSEILFENKFSFRNFVPF